MDTHRIAVLVGSLRKDSYNRKLAQALQQMGRPHLDMTIEEIGQLPLYNEDLDHGPPPAAWATFRERLSACDGVLFVTPEYNRSMPGVLKNALDIGSRPYGGSIWDGKPAGVISCSISAIGGFGANHHLRQSLVFLNMPCMQQPEGYIGHAAKLFDEQGHVHDDSTRTLLRGFIDAYADWVHQHVRSAETA